MVHHHKSEPAEASPLPLLLRRLPRTSLVVKIKVRETWARNVNISRGCFWFEGCSVRGRPRDTTAQISHSCWRTAHADPFSFFFFTQWGKRSLVMLFVRSGRAGICRSLTPCDWKREKEMERDEPQPSNLANIGAPFANSSCVQRVCRNDNYLSLFWNDGRQHLHLD